MQSLSTLLSSATLPSPSPASTAQAAAPLTTPTTSEVSSKSESHSELICKLGVNANLIKRGRDSLVRLRLQDLDEREVERYIRATKLANRHPNTIIPLGMTMHRNRPTDPKRSIDVDMEYADAGKLRDLIPYFPPETRIATALSIAKQIIRALFYMDVVHDLQHRDVSTSTIFLGSNGCAKLGFFDVVDGSTFEKRPDWFINSPYCAPEVLMGAVKRDKIDSKGDTWAVGAVIMAILLGIKLQPKVKNWTEERKKKYEEELKLFNSYVYGGTERMWHDLIPDRTLRYFTRRCLQINKDNRISLAEAAALLAPYPTSFSNSATAASSSAAAASSSAAAASQSSVSLKERLDEISIKQFELLRAWKKDREEPGANIKKVDERHIGIQLKQQPFASRTLARVIAQTRVLRIEASQAAHSEAFQKHCEFLRV